MHKIEGFCRGNIGHFTLEGIQKLKNRQETDLKTFHLQLLSCFF